MRLLKFDLGGQLVLQSFHLSDNASVPPYAILSHTWGSVEDEVEYQDVLDGVASSKPAFSKIEFCGRQAARDGIEYFWVDTCCINKSNSSELQEAITSMFRWYQRSKKCYVYLSDVRVDRERDEGWEEPFQASRWFTRGWTLQELIAPSTVEFFDSGGQFLGDKRELEQQIFEITKIDQGALRGEALDSFSLEQKWLWSNGRRTTREEDRVYCLQGIFGVRISLMYGEGYEDARSRLEEELDRRRHSAKGESYAYPPPDKRFEKQLTTC